MERGAKDKSYIRSVFITVINGALIPLPVCDAIIYLWFIYRFLRWHEGLNRVTVTTLKMLNRPTTRQFSTNSQQIIVFICLFIYSYICPVHVAGSHQRRRQATVPITTRTLITSTCLSLGLVKFLIQGPCKTLTTTMTSQNIKECRRKNGK